jgi:putative MATE family efflux protein
VLPLIFSGILQISFNAADLAVVGRFASHEALAAVGATTSLFHLLINLFMGLSVGVNVIVSRNFGARDHAAVSRSIHTAFAMCGYLSVIMLALGLGLARPMLKIMGTPEHILGQATIYITIIILGLPFLLLYNFGSAIMRAVGDTRRPLYFLIVSGISNVLLNLLFVIVFKMEVAGVALATIIANAISGYLVVRTLMTENGPCRLNLKKLKIDFPTLRSMILIGLPAGIQGTLFSLSNITIQSSVNTFGAEAMAGVTASLTFDAITYTVANSFHQTTISFCSQNMGGKTCSRIPKILLYSLGASLVSVGILGCIGFFFSGPILKLFNTNPEVIKWGMIRLKILMVTYTLCATMEIATGGLRGMGHSTIPAVITLLTVCGTRILWVFCVFPHYRSMALLIASFPISWFLCGLLNAAVLVYFLKRLLSPTRRDCLSKPI